MNIRVLLARCRHAQEELKALRRQLERLRAEKELSAAERYRTLLETREREAVADLARLEELIDKMPNSRTRTIMRYYYLMGWTDAKIGEEMEITDEWARKKRYAAIKALEGAGKSRIA